MPLICEVIMLPYICLDMYEGVVLRKNSTMLQGAIFRGLRSCIGIVIESEQFVIFLHHPAFILDNTFAAILEWTRRREFGSITQIHIYKNIYYPNNDQHVDTAAYFCQELITNLSFSGPGQINELSDPNGFFLLNKEDLRRAIPIMPTECQMMEPRNTNQSKTLMSRAHYLGSRLAYHRGDHQACSIKIMMRADFEKKPEHSDLAPEILSQVVALRTYTSDRIRDMAFEICADPIWAKVLDLDLVSTPEQLLIKLQNHCVFLLEISTMSQALKNNYIKDIKKLSAHQETLMAILPKGDVSLLQAYQQLAKPAVLTK